VPARSRNVPRNESTESLVHIAATPRPQNSDVLLREARLKSNKKYLGRVPPSNTFIKEARGGARGFTLRSYGDGVCGETAPLPSIGEQAPLYS